MRKLAAIILAVAMLAAFAIPAAAANSYNLGINFDETGWANYWYSNNAEDGFSSALTLDMIRQGVRIVMEFDEDVSEEYFEFIHCPSNPTFQWTTTVVEASGSTLTIEFANIDLSRIMAEDVIGVKMGIGTDAHVIDALVSATLIHNAGGTPPPPPPPDGEGTVDDKGGADTGIGDVAVASAIALVAVGAVVFSRKKK